jgi:hypothetical protein
MNQFTIFALGCAGFVMAFLLYAALLSRSRFAFIFWFPFVLLPTGFVILALVNLPASRGHGPGAPLEGLANIAGFAGLIVSGFVLWFAFLQRPSADGAYRPEIVLPTILGYGLLVSLVLYH